MKQLVIQSMEEGALGIGSSLIYAPADYAPTEELVALCAASAPYGGRYHQRARCYRAAATGGTVDRHSRRCCPSLPPPIGREKGIQSPLSTPDGHPTPPSIPIPPLTLHLHHHTSRGHCQTPGFPRERFSPLGGSRSAQPPNSKPCFISPTNPPDSPPVERDTCCLSSQTQELPSEPPRRRTRSSLPPAVTPRCWSLLAVLPDTGPGMLPWCCRRGGRGLLGRTTTPPTHPHPAY